MLALSGAPRKKGDPPWEPVPPQKIAAGNAHSLVVSWKGAADNTEEKRPSLWAWGANRHWQLGSKLSEDTANPDSTRVPLLLKKFDPEASRDADATEEELGDIDTSFIMEVAAGSNHSMVLECVRETDPSADPQTVRRKSQLWSAGNNTNGQLGRKTEDGVNKDIWNLVKLEVRDVDVQAVVQRICCGADHTLAIVNFVNTGVAKETGRVFAWGINANGALGTRRQVKEWQPTEVWFEGVDVFDDDSENSIRHAKCVQLAAGSKHSMALLHDGRVFAWGHGGNGRLGLGKERIGNLQHHGDVAAYDQSYSAQFQPKLVSMGAHESNIKFIAAGESHSGAVDQLGRLYTWGQGAHGRCGHGMNIDIMIPTEVDSLLGVAIKQISFGLMHSMATTAKGTLYAWGKGAATGLDAGSMGIVSTPNLVKIERTALVHQVSAGPMHTLVLMEDGVVYCFGSGSEGRMPSTAADVSEPNAWQDRPRPTKVPKGKREAATGSKGEDVKGWNKIEVNKQSKDTEKKKKDKGATDQKWWPKEIFAGGANSACLLEGADLYLWGSSVLTKECAANSGGKSGDGADDNRWIPAIMKRGLQGKVKEVALGAEHVLVINSESVMFAWGEGRRGQLGTGSLKPASLPTRISHPVDVLGISAGEEHSACIIEGGEAYTWGNAEGGRLGLGGCLTEGYEMMPKQVEIVDTVYDVLLDGVSCGSQHTSFVSKEKELLTFGTGWFGRLGHGNVDNVYSPKVVRVPGGDFDVQTAKCAAFHTCIIDIHGRLWVTGRDRSVCKGGAGHVKTPELFEPFLDPPRYIRELATCEQHTLAVTYLKEPATGKEKTATEIWVWGSNRMGQLGLPPETAAHIETPWLLQLDPKQPDGKPPQIMRVATGPNHSMALVKHKSKHNADLGDSRTRKSVKSDPEVFAWGASGSGRLGVPRQVSTSLAVVPSSAAAPKRRARAGLDNVVTPRRVDDQNWVSRGGDDDHENKDKEQEEEASEQSKVQNWAEVQKQLLHEAADKKPHKLKEREEEISKDFFGYMSHINKLWLQPKDSPSDYTEWNVRLKEKMLETGYIRLLSALGIGGSRFAPRLEGKAKTDPQILQRMQYFEELFFILQQQPLYLANLAKRLLTKRKDDAEVKLFETMVSGMFVELGDTRIRNLYKALLRMVIRREVAHNAKVEDMFEFGKSRLQVMFAHLCTSPHFMATVAYPIVDPKDKESLVSRIIEQTILPQSSSAEKGETDGTNFFATSYDKYKKFRQSNGTTDRRQGEPDDKYRHPFAEQLKTYKNFLVGPDASHKNASTLTNKDDTKTKKDGKKPPESVREFIEKFIESTLKKPENTDIQQLFRFAFQEICSNSKSTRFKQQDKDGSQGEYEPAICTPLTSLLLCGVIGSILSAVSEGSFALLKNEIRKSVITAIKQSRADQDGQELEEWEYDTGGRFNQVISNIATLAETLQRCVHSLRRVKQGQGTDREESDVVSACDDLTEAVNLCLLNALDGKSKKGLFKEDQTETELAVDLYRAHYNMRESRLTFHTEHLLEFANLLKKYMEDAEEGRDMRLEHDKDKDPVFNLVMKLLPRAKRKKEVEEGSEGVNDDHEAATEDWSQAQINNAAYIGESHNFTIRHRFLEFRSHEELQEPTFCQESLAPMPRSLCLESQRKRGKGVARVVKPFRRDGIGDRGPQVTIGNAKTMISGFEELEKIICEMSGGQGNEKRIPYRISGKDPTFSECRASLEEIQKDVSVKMEEGTFGNLALGEKLLKNMDTGIKIIDQLKETHSTNAEGFFHYIEEAIARRAAYHTYLEKMVEGRGDVNKAQVEYLAKVKENCMLLTAVCQKVDACDIPDDILSSSQMYAAGSNKLGFLKAKKAKGQMPPTPAMLVLRELKKNDQDLKETDQLRAELGVPSRSFMSKELINKGVIVSLNTQIPKNVRNNLNFTFQCVDETFIVQAFMRQTLLKEFNITREDVGRMETGRKCAVMPYGDGLVQMNCFRLRRLLAYITAEGGL